jgi:1,4-dihydroxy-2-naphthoate octaprenyltransferase
MTASPSPGERLSIWIQAARPKTLPAAAAPVLLGVGLAVWRGQVAWLPALAALFGALLIQIATNLANDYFDHARGADTEERVGPVRVTAAGLVPPAAVKRAMILTLAAALCVGLYLVAVGGWPIVVIGVVSLVLAVAYTGGPYPLAYNGLGDVFVFVFFGLVAVAGTYYVQALSFPAEAWWLGAGTGSLSTAILVVNNQQPQGPRHRREGGQAHPGGPPRRSGHAGGVSPPPSPRCSRAPPGDGVVRVARRDAGRVAGRSPRMAGLDHDPPPSPPA